MSHAGTPTVATTRRIAAGAAGGTTSHQRPRMVSSPTTVGYPDGMRTRLLILAILGVLAAGLHWWLRPQPDPLAAFPHTFVAAPTYDPATVTVVMAPLSEPPASPSSQGMAWQCDDPAFADAQGRPWIFPGAADARGELIPPLNPLRGKAPDPRRCRRYQTVEGGRLLADFSARNPR